MPGTDETDKLDIEPKPRSPWGKTLLRSASRAGAGLAKSLRKVSLSACGGGCAAGAGAEEDSPGPAGVVCGAHAGVECRSVSSGADRQVGCELGKHA